MRPPLLSDRLKSIPSVWSLKQYFYCKGVNNRWIYVTARFKDYYTNRLENIAIFFSFSMSNEMLHLLNNFQVLQSAMTSHVIVYQYRNERNDVEKKR